MEPPADLKKVASNFKLLREVLDGDTRASLIVCFINFFIYFEFLLANT